MSSTVDIVFIAHPAVFGAFVLILAGLMVYYVVKFVTSVVAGG